jgi:hypothetical protein
VKENGEVPVEDGLTVPAPFSVMVTLVAFPPKVLPLTTTGVVPQVDPLAVNKLTVGPSTHPQSMENVLPVLVQPDEFRTVME